ncbi:MAG: twin-arginine translocase TatA/TatE family subunit [Saprospiraceae bacterium]|nr:twin-arginine translocase TatA/TatE family subunit [Saprospiraceae bacterium]
MNLVLLFNLGGQEILLIALVVLLLFGGRKIPELMRGLGKGIREFNDAKNNIQSEIKSEMRELEKPKIEIKEPEKVKREEISE